MLEFKGFLITLLNFNYVDIIILNDYRCSCIRSVKKKETVVLFYLEKDM